MSEFEAHVTGDSKAFTTTLFHGRFSNFPMQLLPALHQNLLDDIIWAKQQKSKTQDTKPFVGLTHVLLLTTGVQSNSNYEHENNDQGSTSTKNEEKKKKKKISEKSSSSSSSSSSTTTSSNSSSFDVSGARCASLLFDHFEDELYVQEAIAAVAFTHPLVSAGRFCVAALVPLNKVGDVITGLTALVPAIPSGDSLAGENS